MACFSAASYSSTISSANEARFLSVIISFLLGDGVNRPLRDQDIDLTEIPVAGASGRIGLARDFEVDTFEIELINAPFDAEVFLEIDISSNSIKVTPSKPGEFVIRLIQGETQAFDVTFNVLPSQQKVIVGRVIGSTAALNSIAEYSVKLSEAPEDDVVIPLESSNSDEGVTQVEQLRFTPENWQEEQLVVVRGTDPDNGDSPESYSILMGPTQSQDNDFDNLEISSVNMEGLVLRVSAPSELLNVITNISFSIRTSTFYTGEGQLSYSLLNAPEGLEVDFNSGQLSWTPTAAQAGKTFFPTLRVNDGSIFSEVTFQTVVAEGDPISSNVSGSQTEVTDQSSDLFGMTITAIDDPSAPPSGMGSDITEVALFTVPESGSPKLPSNITVVTDVFGIEGQFNSPVEIRLPLGQFSTIDMLGDIEIYSYVTAVDIEDRFWSPLSVKKSYEGDSENPVLVIELSGLSGLLVFGVEDQVNPVSANSFPTPLRTVKPDGPVISQAPMDINCSVVETLVEATDDTYTCSSVTNPELEVTIEGFGDQQLRWGGISKENLVDWLVEAQTWFGLRGFGFSNAFTVNIHSIESDTPGSIILGYVTTSNGENRNTLHLNSDNSISSVLMQGTIVHEYFHHAQGHPDTKQSDQELLITNGRFGSWLIEGSARWFEDELFDNINSYVAEGIGERILEKGLNSLDSNSANDHRDRYYQRFSFMKLLTSKCLSFDQNISRVFSHDKASDPTGINSLVDVLADSNCDFGSHFGAENMSSLDAAIALYNYSTQLKNEISLLDSNESNGSFSFRPTTLEFNQPFFNLIANFLGLSDEEIHRLNSIRSIPAAGAYSFVVPRIEGDLPEGFMAELIINTDKEAIVSIVSEEAIFAGQNQLGIDNHDWFSTREQSNYLYRTQTSVPEVFVTVLNPSVESAIKVNSIEFKIRPVFDADINITSHSQNAQLSNRVIQISGNIPIDKLGSTNRIVVTTNGVQTETDISSITGIFNANAVISLGENIIRVQGFSGSQITTNEAVLVLEGVESNSAGVNALIPSRAVFVLTWSTTTDLDIYSTDNSNATIWYQDRTQGPGGLDVDDTSGFGPEVISYRDGNDAIFTNGQFNIDVHYYSGSPSTDYNLDVILNETEPQNRRSFRFESTAPHTTSNFAEDGPEGQGASRFNDLLRISCGSQRICDVTNFDSSKLTSNRRQEQSTSKTSPTFNDTQINPKPENAKSAFASCQEDLAYATAKDTLINWRCDENGLRLNLE